MAERLEERCRKLMDRHEYKECEAEIETAMATSPHSAVPHNLMGILMVREQKQMLAMRHFRAAYGLDPTYIPARYNLERFGELHPSGKCAFTEADCPVQNDTQFEMVYDDRHVGWLVRR